MVTNTPIDKESFRLTQAAQKVQELLNLIQNLSDSGYTNDLQSLVDVITNWDDTDDSTSFAAQLQKIFTNFLSKQEILPKILSTGETYQTDVNGQTESLGANMPVQSSVIYNAFKEYGIRQLPNGSSWYKVDGKPGYYTATFGSQSTPSEDGLYLYSNKNGINSTDKNLDSIYLVDKNGELFGGTILNGLIANTAAIIKITHTGGAEVIFEAQHTGDYIEQQIVDSLPERTITSDFSSATSYQFMSDNKSTVTLITQDNYKCQMITATGNLSASYYSTASFDFSSIIDKVKYLTVEFDSKIPSMRWYIALVNSTYRPGTSAASAYDDNGVVFKQGIGITSNYMINNVLTTDTDMYNHWVHTKLIVDVGNKTVNYIITQIGTGNKLEGTSYYLDDSPHTNVIDRIEVYTWATGNNIYIANVSISAFDDTTNKTTRYLLSENNGSYSEYMFYDGDFIQIGNNSLVDGKYVPYYDKPSEESIDLNTLTSTGFYAVQTGQGQQDHCPSLDGMTYWESGVVIVCRCDEGCLQIFLNWAIDNDPNSSTIYPSAIAMRTLSIVNDNTVKVSSDWKIINLNTIITTFSDEVFLSKYVDYDTVFSLFPQLPINSLFILNNDVEDYTSTLILINDEVGYKLNTTIQPNTSYLATVTEYPITGADHVSGSIHIYGAVDNRAITDGSITTPKLADGSVTVDKTDFCSYSTEPVKIGTWVDGRDIYRVCWDSTLTDPMISDKICSSGDFVHTGYENIINNHMYYGPNDDGNCFELSKEMWGNEQHICLYVVPDSAKAGDRIWGYVEYIEKMNK